MTQVESAVKEEKILATGRRKTASARIWLKTGTGNIIINDREPLEYLKRKTLVSIIKKPFLVVKSENKFDAVIKVLGSGISSQAGAIRHGLARALVNFNPDFRRSLKLAGFLTRDARMKERKKYGRKRARKSFQFTKR